MKLMIQPLTRTDRWIIRGCLAALTFAVVLKYYFASTSTAAKPEITYSANTLAEPVNEVNEPRRLLETIDLSRAFAPAPVDPSASDAARWLQLEPQQLLPTLVGGVGNLLPIPGTTVGHTPFAPETEIP